MVLVRVVMKRAEGVITNSFTVPYFLRYAYPGILPACTKMWAFNLVRGVVARYAVRINYRVSIFVTRARIRACRRVKV